MPIIEYEINLFYKKINPLNTIFPVANYSIIYYNFLLVITLIVFFRSLTTTLEAPGNLQGKNITGFILMGLILLFIGFRPINFRFGDMVIYNEEFNNYVQGGRFDRSKEFLFELFKYFFAKNLNATSFFFTCAFLYIFPLYLATKKLFFDYSFYAFFLLIISFSFWTYGTNGIRNGIATSLFIYAISRDSKIVKWIILFAIIFIHKSIFIPVIIYLFVSKYNFTKLYLLFWVLCIPISLVLGSFWERFFLGLGFASDKLDSYLGGINQAEEGVTLIIGFRWDFLLYSSVGVLASWYYIYIKKFEDKTYSLICNTYIITNSFWILVIRASYSNRFAYLSWFLLALVLIYPLLKNKIFEHQHRVIGFITLFYFGFTYFLNVILD